MSLHVTDMVTQHLQACRDSGSNPQGDDTAALNFRVLWGTRDSHWHFLLQFPACAQDLPSSLPFLVKKLSMLYDYPYGWNARQNNTRGLFDVVPGIYQKMALRFRVMGFSTPFHWYLLTPLLSCAPSPLLSIFSCPYQNWLWMGDYPCLWMPLKHNFPWNFC